MKELEIVGNVVQVTTRPASRTYSQHEYDKQTVLRPITKEGNAVGPASRVVAFLRSRKTNCATKQPSAAGELVDLEDQARRAKARVKTWRREQLARGQKAEEACKLEKQTASAARSMALHARERRRWEIYAMNALLNMSGADVNLAHNDV